MKRLISRLVFVVAIVGTTGISGAQERDVRFDSLPVNTWSKLPTAEESYAYSQPIYVPARKTILQWGALSIDKPRNDVRAFDVAAGRWTSDYKSTAPEDLGETGIRAEGHGVLLADGTPAPSFIVHGVCYDTKREQLVYVMKGLMAAYDPHLKSWRDLQAESVLEGPHALFADVPYGRFERGLPPDTDGEPRRVAGGPPVHAPGVGYDPLNDEIVLFSHWGGQNNDRRSIDGRISTHTGTWRFSYTDKLWRRVGHTFGSPEVRSARSAVLALMQQLSDALDTAWLARRNPHDQEQAARLHAAVEAIEQAGGKLPELLPSEIQARLRGVPENVRELSRLHGTQKYTEFVAAAALLRQLDALIDGPLRVEPPPRCNAPLVYDSKHKVLVLFGGQNNLVRTDLDRQGRDPAAGGLNDTWLYDVTTRQWREAKCQRRPPAQRQSRLVFDPQSGLLLLLTHDAEDKTLAIWSFDVGKAEWRLRHEQAWTTPLREWTGLALLDAARVLVLENGKETLCYKLDLDQLPGEPAPLWEAPPPVEPQVIPADDPKWVAELRKLPANRWIHPEVPRDAETRDWGIAAADDARGLMYYFGGGHSTYQVNDVAIYAVGANRWVHTAGDHNDWVPPVHWDGISMGIGGGPPAGHQRNSYVVIDGRLWHTASFHSRRWDHEIASQKGTRVAWFYDLDRGGVWRQKPIDAIDLGEGVPGTLGRAHLADPRGKVLGFAGQLEPYDGRFFENEAYFNEFDVERNRLRVRKIPKPLPDWVGEGRPFCWLKGRDQIFFYEFREQGGHRTWIYDIQDNRFQDLKPTRQPPADSRTVVYLPDQDAVFAIIGDGDQWVYSFKSNAWEPLTLSSDKPVGFATPYAQLVYVEKYGVLVNTGSASRGIAVMRPVCGAEQ